MGTTRVSDLVAYPFLPSVSTIPYPHSSLNDLYRCLRTMCSREILHTNTWPARPTEPLAHASLTGLPARRRPIMLTVALRHPFQCSCRLCSVLLDSPDTLFQERLSIVLSILLVATPSATALPTAQRTITAETELPPRHTLV